MLEVYIEGARDADAMLGRLAETFAGTDEPVVLVYFGDHLPYLGDNQLAYEELGITADPEWDALRSFETPSVVSAQDPNGQDLTALEEAIHQWRCWSYYKLQYKEIPG